VVTGSPKKPRKSGPLATKSPLRNSRLKKGKREEKTEDVDDDDDADVELIETKEYDFKHLSSEEHSELWHRLAIITLHFQPTETWYAEVFGEKKKDESDDSVTEVK